MFSGAAAGSRKKNSWAGATSKQEGAEPYYVIRAPAVVNLWKYRYSYIQEEKSCEPILGFKHWACLTYIWGGTDAHIYLESFEKKTFRPQFSDLFAWQEGGGRIWPSFLNLFDRLRDGT